MFDFELKRTTNNWRVFIKREVREKERERENIVSQKNILCFLNSITCQRKLSAEFCQTIEEY
jgi:hypothetical protein